MEREIEPQDAPTATRTARDNRNASSEPRRELPRYGCPGVMSPAVAEAIGLFQDIDVLESKSVEPASIAPFCTFGDFMILSSLAGTGKTTLAADLLLGAAHPDRLGLALGGLFRVAHNEGKSTRCAVIDAEGTRVRWESILRRKIALEGLDPKLLGSIRYIRAAEFQLHNPYRREEASRTLAEALAHDERRIVFLDTVAAVWSPGSLNDAEWVFAGLKAFRETAQAHGITCVGLAHTRRKSRDEGRPYTPIGSSQQENQADVVLSASRIKNGGLAGVSIAHHKSRRSFWIVQGSSVCLRFTAEFGFTPEGSWESTWPHEWSASNGNPDVDSLPLLLQIERAFKQAGSRPLTTSNLVEQLGGSDRTIRSHIGNLVARGFVRQERSGRSTRYRLAP